MREIPKQVPNEYKIQKEKNKKWRKMERETKSRLFPERLQQMLERLLEYMASS